MLNLVKMELYRTVRATSTWIIVACVVAVAVFCTAMTALQIDGQRESDEKTLRDALSEVDGLNTEGMSVEEMLPLLWQLEDKEFATDVYMNVTMGGAPVGDTPMGDMGDMAEGLEDGLSGESSENEDEITFTLGINGGGTWHKWVYNDIDFWELLSDPVSGGMPLLLLAIFVAILANAEQKNGFVKNIAGQLPHRGMLVGSKLMMMILSVLGNLGLFSLATLISGKLFWGDKLVFGDSGTVLKIFAVWFLLYLAFAGIVYVFCVLSRGAALGMTIGILLCTGFGTMFYGGLSLLVQKCLGWEKFNLSKITIENTLAQITVFAESKDVTHAICVGAVYLVVTIGGAVLLMQKRDVR